MKEIKLFINGEFRTSNKDFTSTNPANNEAVAKVYLPSEKDIDDAVDAAEVAFHSTEWRSMDQNKRADILEAISEKLKERRNELTELEIADSGSCVRKAKADVHNAANYFKVLAGQLRKFQFEVKDEAASRAGFSQNYKIYEPVGVCAQIIPWNFPLLMATWKIAPALAAGCTVVVKPAEQTPTSIMCLMELIADILPAGVLNIVTGFGVEAGKPLASSPRISKVSFTGETTTGRLIMQYASENLIPVTMELGGKSPNIFFPSVADHDDAFFDKAIEGAVMFALNQGEVCTCPSRILVHESIYEKFMKRVVERTKAIKVGHPLDGTVMMGAQASNDQYEKILSYLKIGKEEGAEVLCGGEANKLEGELGTGYYIQPTIFKGHNKMRIFQEEIFGPVVSVTTFKTTEEALEIANDTLYGLGAGVWTRDAHELYQVPRAIQAGRVWVNCYHAYPAHAPFGGYKKSGFGRENHKMMLSYYRQTKNMLVSYDKNKLGFF